MYFCHRRTSDVDRVILLNSMMIMRKFFFVALAALTAAASAQAQTSFADTDYRVGCLRNDAVTRADYTHALPAPYTFDSLRTYRQPVVLISFKDMDFSMEDPAAYYNRMFNEQGFNEGDGKGCVADYFRDQSAGLLNLQFDIYGPVKVDESAVNTRYRNYAEVAVRKACKALYEKGEYDFSIYDWDGDGSVNQVLFIVAGYAGSSVEGYTWPSSGFFFAQLPGGVDSYFNSVSCERWADESLCGIGTVIHEFFHCLGLPDIYPMRPATAYSAVDEWDLMDGGNNTGKGWCPPNLSVQERMYLGWTTPVELTGPVTIENMKPVSDGGETYIVRSTSNNDEYYLLENRRQAGWDYGCPGNGLLIFHVDFDMEDWRNNYVNSSDSHYRYDLFHADGKDYVMWDPDNNGKNKNKWTMDNWMRSSYLSTSPYPYSDPLLFMVNDALTDNSSPAATLFTATDDDRSFMGKAITNIRMASDGTISFDFMKDGGTGIGEIEDSGSLGVWYDLYGRRLDGEPSQKGIYIRDGSKLIIK